MPVSSWSGAALDSRAPYGRPLQLHIETKHPTRYGGLVERRLVDVLGDFGWDKPGSPARVMTGLLEYLTDRYGSPTAYLRAGGLRDHEIAELRRVLVSEA